MVKGITFCSVFVMFYKGFTFFFLLIKDNTHHWNIVHIRTSCVFSVWCATFIVSHCIIGCTLFRAIVQTEVAKVCALHFKPLKAWFQTFFETLKISPSDILRHNNSYILICFFFFFFFLPPPHKTVFNNFFLT